MKKLLSSVLLTATVQAFACGGYIDFPKWSIGVIGAGNYGLMNQNWHPFFLPGIQLNRKMNYNMELRFAVEHTKYYNAPMEMQGNDMLSITGEERRTLFRVGAEKSWKLHKLFMTYVALDLAAQSKRTDLT